MNASIKEFILQDYRKTLNKILYGIKRIEEKDNKVTIITLTFSMNEYEKIKNAESFGKLLNGIFPTEKNENQSRIEAFIDENEIRMGE